MKSRPAPDARPLGSVHAGDIMPVKVLCAKLGWQRKTLAHAKASGLQTVRFGRFDYVTGDAVLEFFRQVAG
jgi:hypothetical protein